jgi:hypothetical protein
VDSYELLEIAEKVAEQTTIYLSPTSLHPEEMTSDGLCPMDEWEAPKAGRFELGVCSAHQQTNGKMAKRVVRRYEFAKGDKLTVPRIYRSAIQRTDRHGIVQQGVAPFLRLVGAAPPILHPALVGASSPAPRPHPANAPNVAPALSDHPQPETPIEARMRKARERKAAKESNT